MTGKKNKVSIFHFCFANLKKRRLLDGNRLHLTPIYKVPFHMKTPPSRVVVPHSSHQQHRVGIFHPGLRCGSAISPPSRFTHSSSWSLSFDYAKKKIISSIKSRTKILRQDTLRSMTVPWQCDKGQVLWSPTCTQLYHKFHGKCRVTKIHYYILKIHLQTRAPYSL